MQAVLHVGLDFVVEGVGPPALGEEDDGDALAEPVQLQATGTDGCHDGRIVDDAHVNARLRRAELHVAVRGRAEDVADN